MENTAATTAVAATFSSVWVFKPQLGSKAELGELLKEGKKEHRDSV